MGRHIESQREQWPHRVASLHTADPIDWSGVRSGPLVDAPLREQEPDDIFSSRPYEGAICETCNRPTRLVSGPYCRHAVRVRIAMPMPTTLQLSNQQPEDTGSHGMAVYEDHQGDWSLKQPKPSLAFTVPLEAAASTLQRTMGLEAPESYAIEHQGRPAVVSKWYPGSSQAFQKPPPLESLHPDDQMTIQKNHVLDWMIGNHDSHVGNWIRNEDGKLVSIDKGQSVKYFGHDRLDPTFHPNYYARPPIYNRLWNDHAQGRGQMHDPRTGELGQFVKRVQSMPDEKLKSLFRPYAQAAAQSGLLLNPDQDPSRRLGPRRHPANDPEAFLHALVQRKNNLHNDLGDYYDQMSQGRHIVGATSLDKALNRGQEREPELNEDEEWAYNADGVVENLGITPEDFDQLTKMKGAPKPTHTIDDEPHWNEEAVDDWWALHQKYLDTPGSGGDWSPRRSNGIPKAPYIDLSDLNPRGENYTPRHEDWMYEKGTPGQDWSPRAQLEFEPWQKNELPRPEYGNIDPNFARNNGYNLYNPWRTDDVPHRWGENPDSLVEFKENLKRLPGPGQMDLFGGEDHDGNNYINLGGPGLDEDSVARPHSGAPFFFNNPDPSRDDRSR